MSLFTDLRDTAETAAVLAGNYYAPGSSLLTSRLTSQGSQNQLNSGIGQLAQLGTGAYGAYSSPSIFGSSDVTSTPVSLGSVSETSLPALNGSGNSLENAYTNAQDAQDLEAVQNQIAQGAPSKPITPDVTSKPFQDDPVGWLKAHAPSLKTGMYTLGGLGLLSALTSKPNYITPYQPPTAQQYGLNARLASNYQPVRTMADGGITNLPVEQMSNQNSSGQNTGYPQAYINKGAYATPWQTPISRNIVSGDQDTGVNQYTGDMLTGQSSGISGLMGYAAGGSIGSYSDGGQMLEGPGDGMSDSIPATISNKQPARLADGEFVVPADVVSHLGNGSTDAGAKQLYKMMDKVRQARTGRKSQGRQIKPQKYLPA